MNMANESMQEADLNAIAVDAIEFSQASHRMFVTSLTAQQLIEGTTVDNYNSTLAPDDPNQGYQRPPERSRITRIGTYLIKHMGSGLYPNPVLLSSRAPLRFDPVSRRLELPTRAGLRVIDGQHRIAGLRYAINEKEEESLAFLQIPVVILETASRHEEMDQFKIINSSAKSVRTDLVNSILTAMAESQGIDTIPEKDQWRVVVTKVVDALNHRDDSPWHNVLLMPDEVGKRDAGGKTTRATSAMTSIRPVYEFLAEHPKFTGKSLDDRADGLADVLVAYWRAIRSVVPDAFDDPEQYVIQKTPGLFSLHYLLKDELLHSIYWGRRDWDEATFKEFIADSPEITDATFWHKGEPRAAAYGSMKGFRDLANLLIDSVKREG